MVRLVRAGVAEKGEKGMSGVYIKGMEMPTEGCVVAIYKINGKFYAGNELCEVIPVPNHGNLIDRDALEADLNIWQGDYADSAFSETAIDDAPVIIPADKEGA